MTPSPHIKTIQALDLPELRPFRTLRRTAEHFQEGLFVAEGEKVVRRLLQSDLQVVSLLVTPEWYEKLASDIGMRQEPSLTVFVGSRELVQQIVGFTLHQGIMATGRVPADRPLDEVIDDLPSPHMLVALDGLRQAENVGVITRNCVAFGVDAIIAGETSCSPYLRRAVRNSMGTVFKLPVIHADNLKESLRTLHAGYGTRILATDPHSSVPISSADLTGNICIVFGNEDTGISPELLSISGERLAIPMQNQTDSLNVGSASAVCFYEVRRQRMAPA